MKEKIKKNASEPMRFRGVISMGSVHHHDYLSVYTFFLRFDGLLYV
jgi:hypothetical protein